MRDTEACFPPGAAAALSFWRFTTGPSALWATSVEGMAARNMSVLASEVVVLSLRWHRIDIDAGKYFCVTLKSEAAR
jgi:hypothetical protein